MFKLKSLTILGVLIFFSCTQKGDIGNACIMNVDWAKLSTLEYSIYYAQLRFDNYPTEETINQELLTLFDSNIVLTNHQTLLLQELITDTSNFSQGDCGTFHLNGGMVIMKNDTIHGVISMGCGFNQWKFEPENSSSKFGSFNDKGFFLMSQLLDEINTNGKLNE